MRGLLISVLVLGLGKIMVMLGLIVVLWVCGLVV